MSPCDNTLKNFVLQDIQSGSLKVYDTVCWGCSFNTKGLCVCCLQPNSFVFVSRCAKSFGEKLYYVFWCSCDPKRAQLVDCLPTVNTESFQTFEQQLPPCQHIMAARIVLEEVDSINDISPSLEFAGTPFNRTGGRSREALRTFFALDKHSYLHMYYPFWFFIQFCPVFEKNYVVYLVSSFSTW